MNIVDLAIRRAEQRKVKIQSAVQNNEMIGVHYKDTTYVAILENDQIMCSVDPIVLEDAKSCILIHRRSQLAQTNYYDWFDVEYINENGETFEECIDKEFSLHVTWRDSFSDQRLFLGSSKYDHYYFCSPTWSNTASIKDCLQSVWNLYNELKKAETQEERRMIAELYEKDETILQQKKEIADFSYANAILEKERDMYKGLLDDIKKLHPQENQ